MDASGTTISEIMTRDVVTVGVDETLAAVRDAMVEFGFHHILVVESGRVVGVVSDRDLLRNISPFVGKMAERPQDVASLNRRVHQVMSRRMIVVDETTRVCEALRLVLEHGVSCLPVLDGAGRCRGIVTSRDLLGWALLRCDAIDRCERGEAA